MMSCKMRARFAVPIRPHLISALGLALHPAAHSGPTIDQRDGEFIHDLTSGNTRGGVLRVGDEIRATDPIPGTQSLGNGAEVIFSFDPSNDPSGTGADPLSFIYNSIFGLALNGFDDNPGYIDELPVHRLFAGGVGLAGLWDDPTDDPYVFEGEGNPPEVGEQRGDRFLGLSGFAGIFPQLYSTNNSDGSTSLDTAGDALPRVVSLTGVDGVAAARGPVVFDERATGAANEDAPASWRVDGVPSLWDYAGANVEIMTGGHFVADPAQRIMIDGEGDVLGSVGNAVGVQGVVGSGFGEVLQTTYTGGQVGLTPLLFNVTGAVGGAFSVEIPESVDDRSAVTNAIGVLAGPINEGGADVTNAYGIYIVENDVPGAAQNWSLVAEDKVDLRGGIQNSTGHVLIQDSTDIRGAIQNTTGNLVMQDTVEIQSGNLIVSSGYAFLQEAHVGSLWADDAPLYLTGQNSGGLQGNGSHEINAFGGMRWNFDYDVTVANDLSVNGNFHADGQEFRGGANARARTAMLTRDTANATQTELTLDGGSPGAGNRVTISSGRTYAVTVRVSARQQSGTNSAMYVRRCLIANNGGTTALVGSVQTEGTDIESNSTWNVTLAADNTNDSVQVLVTGAASANIRWGAQLEAVEVAY